jgi:hypothetical protein
MPPVIRGYSTRDVRKVGYTPHNAIELNGRVVAELTAIQDNQELLRSFFHVSDLPLPLTLLS